MRDVVLTTEEEGVALAAGAWLGGQRAALLMQSSGVGNCINMLSLIKQLPLSAADARHDARRMGRVQSVAGADGSQSIEPVLDSDATCRSTAPTTPTRSPTTVEAALDLAFGGDLAVAVLLSQRLIGRKVWVK